MKILKWFNWLLSLFLVFFLISCGNQTMEQQVEEMLVTTDYSERRDIAFALADSLDPRSVELVVGAAGGSSNAKDALNKMLERYKQLCSSKDKEQKAMECIALIPSIEAANFMGELAVTSSNNGSLALAYIKRMPLENRKSSLLTALSKDVAGANDSVLYCYLATGNNATAELIAFSNKLAPSHIEVVIEKIVRSNSSSYNSKYDAVLCGLRRIDLSSTFRVFLNKSLKDLGRDYMLKLIEDYYADSNSSGILIALRDYGNDVITYLIAQLSKDERAEELLAKLGDSAVSALTSKMKSSEQDIRFAAADALVKMYKYNPSSVQHLTDAFDSQSVGAVAQNYPFYIRMGLAGTEELLLKALDKRFSESMCLDYLNCGNGYVERRANEIAEEHGYYVYSDVGSHSGPIWGSGN
jgi:hypothetical protein